MTVFVRSGTAYIGISLRLTPLKVRNDSTSLASGALSCAWWDHQDDVIYIIASTSSVVPNVLLVIIVLLINLYWFGMIIVLSSNIAAGWWCIFHLKFQYCERLLRLTWMWHARLFTSHLEDITLPLIDVVGGVWQCRQWWSAMPFSMHSIYQSCVNAASYYWLSLFTADWRHYTKCAIHTQHACNNVHNTTTCRSVHLFIQGVFQEQNETIVQHGIVSILKT